MFDKTLAMLQKDIYSYYYLVDTQDILTSKGGALNTLGRSNDAIGFYDKALAIDANNTLALLDKGVAVAELGRYNQAIGLYNRVLALNANDFKALNNEGKDLSHLGNYNAAVFYFGKALALSPNDYTTLINQGDALSHLGRTNEARTYYAIALAHLYQVLAIYPNDMYALASKNKVSGILNESATKPPSLLGKTMTAGNMTNTTRKASPSRSHLLTYENLTAGFQIKYPSSWQKSENITSNSSSVYFLGPLSEAKFYVASFKIPQILAFLPNNVMLSIISHSMANALLAFPSYHPTQSISTTLAGNPANKTEFTYINSTTGNPSRAMIITSISGGKWYLLSYQATRPSFPIFLRDAQEMINSFAPIKQPSILSNIHVGGGERSGPKDAEVNPITNTIYVANGLDNSTSVVDGKTNKEILRINVGKDPTSVAVTPNTNRVYVANSQNHTVSVFPGMAMSVVPTVHRAVTNTTATMAIPSNLTAKNATTTAATPNPPANATNATTSLLAAPSLTTSATNITTSNMTNAGNPTNMTARNLTSNAANQTTNKTSFLTYKNSTYGIRMLYPSVWSANRTTIPSGGGGFDVATFSPSDQRVYNLTGHPYFSVGIDNLGNSTVSLDGYFKSTLKDINSTFYPSLKQIEATTNNVTLGGHHAYRIAWTYMDPLYRIQTVAIESGTVIGDKGYFVAFDSDASKYHSYLPTVQRMIDSLKITPTASLNPTQTGNMTNNK